jgi:hypothetical protein
MDQLSDPLAGDMFRDTDLLYAPDGVSTGALVTAATVELEPVQPSTMDQPGRPEARAALQLTFDRRG